MTVTILAEATGKADDFGAGDLVGLILISVVIFGVLPYLVVLLRKVLRLYEKEVQFQDRKSEHLDATERHMAAVDQTLAQILEELKRRPSP